jgi:hypothetical protein
MDEIHREVELMVDVGMNLRSFAHRRAAITLRRKYDNSNVLNLRRE